MKYFIILNLFFGLWMQFNKIANTNEIKSEAETAYLSNDYKKASALYHRLINDLHLEDEKVRLNFANALFLNNEKKKSAAEYQILTNSTHPATSSIAFQQLGVIAALKGKYEISLLNFKQALKTNPNNEKARYNYELIKKIREQELFLQQTQLKQDKNGSDKKEFTKRGNQQEKDDLTKKANSNSYQETQKGDKQKGGNLFDNMEDGDHQKNSKEKDPFSNDPDKEPDLDKKGNKEKEALKTKRLQENNLSEEKAKMILELMKNEEIQYIQQRKKTDQNKDYKNKPDW